MKRICLATFVAGLLLSGAPTLAQDAQPESLMAAAPFKSRFAGAYVAVTSGYDFSTKDAGPTSLGSGFGAYTYPNVPAESLAGFKIGGATGYNVVSGPILFGFEARGQFNFARSQASVDSTGYSTALPFPIASLSCFGCSQSFLDNYPIPAGYGPITLQSQTTITTVTKRPWMADGSARLGMILGDWLVYSRAGVGAEQTETKTTVDSSGSRLCNSPLIVRTRPDFNSVTLTAVSCGTVTPGPITTTTTASITPIVSLAVGLERDVGPIFLRLEAEMINHFNGSTVYYTPAANLAVGYRF
jgi:opacity protein-like surface antigen